MSELFLYLCLFLMCLTFNDNNYFNVLFLSLLYGSTNLVSFNSLLILTGLATAFPLINGLPIILLGTSYYASVSIVGVLFSFALYAFLIHLAHSFIRRHRSVFVESRRLFKSIGAMKIIYGVLFIFMAITLFKSGMALNMYITIICFVLALICFFYFHFSPIIPLAISIIIAYFLY